MIIATGNTSGDATAVANVFLAVQSFDSYV